MNWPYSLKSKCLKLASISKNRSSNFRGFTLYIMCLPNRFVIQDYEERRLESSKWISTTIIGVYQELAKIEGFKLLQAYIQGQNEEGMYTILLQLIRDYEQRVVMTRNYNNHRLQTKSWHRAEEVFLHIG